MLLMLQKVWFCEFAKRCSSIWAFTSSYPKRVVLNNILFFPICWFCYMLTRGSFQKLFISKKRLQYQAFMCGKLQLKIQQTLIFWGTPWPFQDEGPFSFETFKFAIFFLIELLHDAQTSVKPNVIVSKAAIVC